MTRSHRFRLRAQVAVAVLSLALGACSGSRRPVQPAVPLEPAAPGEPAPATDAGLAHADALFAAGEYADAVAAYGDWLRAHAGAEAADRALFRQALAHVALARAAQGATGHPETEVVRTLLSRLLEHYPSSPYAPAAAQMLDWLTEAHDLRQRLEALKRIDLGTSSDPSQP